ncbi:MAG: translation elongation factor Ts [Chloroflexi bacterium]|nr:translation elongation factor Ts [Chloroflexota bacterium]
MEPTLDTIKELREATGAGVMDCKRALQEANGDIEKAKDILKEKGMKIAAKKSDRAANEGMVHSYIHSGGRVGALVELNCETDFVARTDDFKALAHGIAMQVAAMSPQYVDEGDIPENLKDKADPREVTLMQQAFIKDPSLSVQDMVNEAIGKMGENIKVRRFIRFALGE